jgi:hypothetical protein
LLLFFTQVEFEKGTRRNVGNDLTARERTEQEFKKKARILGNVKFVGELFLTNMLPSQYVFFVLG